MSADGSARGERPTRRSPSKAFARRGQTNSGTWMSPSSGSSTARASFIHAVIDNVSRRILAWHVASRLEPGATSSVLAKATKNLPAKTAPATVVTDSGVENVNH